MTYPAGFDRGRAIELAGLVGQAYRQLDAFRKDVPWKPEGDYTQGRELQYTGAQAAAAKRLAGSFEKEFRLLATPRSHGPGGPPIGFMARRMSDAYLVFRGTMTTTEWIRDFSIRLTRYPSMKSGKVHEGFLQTYEVFRETIHDGLKDIGTGKRLFITGHSLGAALATLAAADIVSAQPVKTLIVYTFGSPRVGDREFAAEFNHRLGDRSFRIANTCDLVVSIPFPVPFLGLLGGYFTHVDTPVEFTVQEENAEKNHDLATYLKALEGERGSKRFFRSLWGR